MHSASPSAVRPPQNFNFAADVFDRWEQVQPGATALWWVSHGTKAEQRFTFRELAKVSRQAAGALHAHGIKRGDRVMVMLPRVPQWWIAMLALTRLGAVPVPATLLLTARDVSFRLETARVAAIITDREGAQKSESFDGLRLFVGGSPPAGWIDFDGAIQHHPVHFPTVQTRQDEPGILYFTSATTGEPKMVLHTQASYGLGHAVTGHVWLALKPGDIHWNISDLGWGKAAWSSFFGPWHAGACVFALDTPGKFDPVLTLDTLANFPITNWCAPPTALRLIIRQDLSRWRFPRLRHCVSAGEPLNPEVFNRWQAATGLCLHEGYGQTETVVLIANRSSEDFRVRPGSMGKVVPGMTLGLLDERLNQVPEGIEGEIAVRVNPVRPLGLFKEYWLNPQENERKFRGDWYLTGDRAIQDADGYYWFIGRKDDVIKSSGYRIGPFEVESALMEHADVLDVAVVGKPDPLRGQIVKACVVLRPGVAGSDELKTQLQAHCKRLVAAYKYPREIEFVTELPKTTSGKTRHVELRRLETESAPHL